MAALKFLEYREAISSIWKTAKRIYDSILAVYYIHLFLLSFNRYL